MVLKFLLLAALVGVALASGYHHSQGYHGDRHDGYHHMSHHGNHGGHHGHGYQDEHHGHEYHSGHHGNGYHGSHQGHGHYNGHYGHGHHGGHHGHAYNDHHDYHHDNIDYKFKYDVKDPKTYNYQSREEYKDGKNVYGSYSLAQPDGKIRVVKYKADGYGFHADVDYKGGYQHEYKPSYGHHDYY